MSDFIFYSLFSQCDDVSRAGLRGEVRGGLGARRRGCCNQGGVRGVVLVSVKSIYAQNFSPCAPAGVRVQVFAFLCLKLPHRNTHRVPRCLKPHLACRLMERTPTCTESGTSAQTHSLAPLPALLLPAASPRDELGLHLCALPRSTLGHL